MSKDDNLGTNITEGLRKNFTKDFGPFLSMGFQLAAGVIAFFFIGYWLDGKLGTSPWFALAGVALGAAGGLIKFTREAIALGKKADQAFKKIEKNKGEAR